MSSAAKVGEIFTKAGDSYNKLGTMIMRLHPTGQELTALEEAVAKQGSTNHFQMSKVVLWISRMPLNH